MVSKLAIYAKLLGTVYKTRTCVDVLFCFPCSFRFLVIAV